MAIYGNWKEKREYRVWAGEETWAVATVSQNVRNGCTQVSTDGDEEVYHSRSLEDSYTYAQRRVDELAEEAKESCSRSKYCSEDCENASINPYGYAHGVRIQVVDMETGYAIDPFEL